MYFRALWCVTKGKGLGVAGGICLCLLVTVQWACESQRAENSRTPPVLPSSGQRYVGFAIFGPDWVTDQPSLNEAELLAHLEEQGYLVAKHTSLMYGNMVRIPISVWSVLGRSPIYALVKKPIYELEDAALCDALKKGEEELQEALALLNASRSQIPLRLRLWDALLTGIVRYNRELGATDAQNHHPIFVDLLLTDRPPEIIIESPVSQLLQQRGCNVSSTHLWQLYKQVQIDFVRELVRRYGMGYRREESMVQIPVAAAIEMMNEPDYVWLPDEAQLEQAKNPQLYPCDKYITQLHLTQIPENDLPGKGCGMRSGYYSEQELDVPRVTTPLKDFRWGLKFDKYVASFAELHEVMTAAVQDEIRRGGTQMRVVSAAVTHVNIDWFARMFRANTNTFLAVDAVGIHPYHWPDHNVHDMKFVGGLPPGDGMSVNPRTYARRYFKQFAFLERLADLTKKRDVSGTYGLAGKPLWITEFGLPTKKVSKYNADLRHLHGMFIYDRATPIPADLDAIVWEDRWEAFFRQVSPAYLKQNNVQAFFIYTLRESTIGQANDDDHSNFALYRPDWSLRMAPDTFNKIPEFFRQFRDGE